jgi:hypothetical protein
MNDKYDCFAAREIECDALGLMMKRCPRTECHFFKTKERAEKDRAKALKRIGKMPKEQRKMIEDTYFKQKR